LANSLAEKNIELVYGGGSVGLMGKMADAVIEKGGQVIGVIPEALARREVAHGGLDDLRVVGSMHERKALMAELSDGFIALPGGLGTLDEFCEILTWAQLGFHQKPCGILNVNGYFNQLLQFFDSAVEEKFIKPEHREMILVESDPETLLTRFESYLAPTTQKWMLDPISP